MKRILLALLFFTLSSVASIAQSPGWVWAQAGSGAVYAFGLSVDKLGNSYYTGYFSGGSTSFGGYTLTNNGGNDMFVVKYDPSGNVLWARSSGGSNDDEGYCSAVDTSGNVYVGGMFLSSAITFGVTTLSYSGGGAAQPFIVKYDANGNVLWAKCGSGGGGNTAQSMGIDEDGDTYLGGYFSTASLTFGAITLNSSGNNNMFLTKYNTNGGVVWAKTANGNGSTGTSITAVQADSMGNVYVTGDDYTPSLVMGSSVLTLVGSVDAFVAKYDSGGNTIWAKNLGGTGGSGPYNSSMTPSAETVDHNGNVYVTGQFNTGSISFGSSTITDSLLGGAYYAYFIAKYDSEGNPQWAQSAGGWNEEGYSLAVDADNNVYAAGIFMAPKIIFGSYTFYNSNPLQTYTDYNGYFVKYNGAGNVLWAYQVGKFLDGSRGDAPTSIAVNRNSIYAVGQYTSDSLVLGNILLTNATAGNLDAFLVKLTTCGLTLSTSSAASSCSMATGSATVTATNGIPPYIYSWTNGSKTASADSLSSGLYIVTVTDSSGCQTTAAVNIADAGAPIITPLTVANVICNGTSTGAISISVSGGAVPYSFYWDNGSISQNINNLTAGPYQVEVTDANGCKVTQVISISQPPSFSISLNTSASSCNQSTGSATATVSGGSGGYVYLWTPSVQTGYTASSLAAGSYSVMVSDIAGCKDSAIADVEDAGGPIVTITNITGADCFTGRKGIVTISDTGGVTPYTYLWSNGATSSNLTEVVGDYNVTVTDKNGCKGVTSAEIQDTLPVGVSICEVTVDSNQENQVIWSRTKENRIAYYNIYRETTLAGQYHLAASQPVDSLSIWTDPIAVPQSRSYRYKISEVDSCGNESPLSNDARTIHLSVDLEVPVGTYKLIWDDNYEGVVFDEYYIYRDTSNAGFVLIDSIPNNGTQTYNDYCPGAKIIMYYVGIDNPNSCNPTRSFSTSPAFSASNRRGIGENTSPAGIEQLSQSTLSVYPNPTSSVLNIRFQRPIEGTVVITDVLGQNVFSKTINLTSNTKIDVSNLSSGVYFVTVLNSTSLEVTKFIKN